MNEMDATRRRVGELEAIVEGPDEGPLPVLVAVHGIGRRFGVQAEAWRSLAADRGMLMVVPHFDAECFDDYQRLGRTGRGRRADLALIALLDRLVDEGRAQDRVHLVGYSGGGQFAHRFTLAWPTRVRAVVSVAAGWYTFPDRTISYPYGVRASSRLPGVRFDLQGALDVPALVAVGALDEQRDAQLRANPRVLRQQGPHRVARARKWADEMNRMRRARGLAGHTRVETLPDAGHSFGQCMKAGLRARVAAFFDEVESEREAV